MDGVAREIQTIFLSQFMVKWQSFSENLRCTCCCLGYFYPFSYSLSDLKLRFIQLKSRFHTGHSGAFFKAHIDHSTSYTSYR